MAGARDDLEAGIGMLRRDMFTDPRQARMQGGVVLAKDEVQVTRHTDQIVGHRMPGRDTA